MYLNPNKGPQPKLPHSYTVSSVLFNYLFLFCTLLRGTIIGIYNAMGCQQTTMAVSTHITQTTAAYTLVLI